jgi:hypothetical protein
MRTTCFLAFAALMWPPAAGTEANAERNVRQRIQEEAAALESSGFYLPDALYWTGADAYPRRLNEPAAHQQRESIAVVGRKNVKRSVTLEALTVAGDSATEYSTFHLAYDDNEGHKDVYGALLRVWQRRNGTWKVAAVFQRPYGRVRPVDGVS